MIFGHWIPLAISIVVVGAFLAWLYWPTPRHHRVDADPVHWNFETGKASVTLTKCERQRPWWLALRLKNNLNRRRKSQ